MWTRYYISPDPYSLTCLAWVTLPEAYAPDRIALWVIRVRKPPHRDKMSGDVSMELVLYIISVYQYLVHYRSSENHSVRYT
jgi:hypothetical protein